MSRKKIGLPTENYLERVSIFFLNMIGRGFILSPVDIAIIEKWERLGYPLVNVLNGLKSGLDKVLAIRGEPYSALKCYEKYVEEEIGKLRGKSAIMTVKRKGISTLERGIKKIEKVSEDSSFYQKYQEIRAKLIELLEKYSNKSIGIREINCALEYIDMEMVEFAEESIEACIKKDLLNEAKRLLKGYRFIDEDSYNETLKEIYLKLIRKYFNIIKFGV